jgi:hypothetical protein
MVHKILGFVNKTTPKQNQRRGLNLNGSKDMRNAKILGEAVRRGPWGRGREAFLGLIRQLAGASLAPDYPFSGKSLPRGGPGVATGSSSDFRQEFPDSFTRRIYPQTGGFGPCEFLALPDKI